MDAIKARFNAAKKLYDMGQPSMQKTLAVVDACLARIEGEAEYRSFGRFNGKPIVEYHAAFSGTAISRPVRPDLFINSRDEFGEAARSFVKSLNNGIVTKANDAELINKVIYTAVSSVCLAYDLWQPGSRKTPGTFFELFMGGAFYEFVPDYQFQKHIRIENVDASEEAVVEEVQQQMDVAEDGDDVVADTDSVATDIVIVHPKTKRGAVIPLKITTRERIVQPFAHQRILESAYPGKYQSFITCISETQLDKKDAVVKQICVPGTVKLFQKHLGTVAGLYYCDAPQRYFRDDFQKVMPVKLLPQLFGDIQAYLQS